jgi:hypothetical protein
MRERPGGLGGALSRLGSGRWGALGGPHLLTPHLLVPHGNLQFTIRDPRFTILGRELYA